MNLKNFAELRDLIHRYNSTSILRVGTKKCWQNWEMWNTKYSDTLDWLCGNTERNYIIRIMLLASSSNPHRHGDISIKEFDELINAYHNLDSHTISDKNILDNEAVILMNSIQEWEINNNKKVKKFSLHLSDILSLDLIRSHTGGLFAQRLVAFQNSSFGYPFARILRTIKIIEIFSQYFDESLSDIFGDYEITSQVDYFWLFFACFSIFKSSNKDIGFCDFNKFPVIETDLKKSLITEEKIQKFIKQNSILFSSNSDNSFRIKVNQTLNAIPDFYQSFLYNYFLEFPLIALGNEKFCLPDPISFIESCWNQITKLIPQNSNIKNDFGKVFEQYIESVLLPSIAPNSFEKIDEVTNPNSSQDKRADFQINTTNAYILLECKSSLMSADTSAYFDVDKLADLWYRIHSAVEQISGTIKALKLCDKPIIPLVLTFYDSIDAALVFQEMLKETDYCSRMSLNMPPVVYSLHEFEHWISDRSLDNWVDLILSKQNNTSPTQSDNQGHNYRHLSDIFTEI